MTLERFLEKEMTKDNHLYFSGDYEKKLTENGEYTRDIPFLNTYKNHYLFVYGTLKRGNTRHNVLANSRESRFGGVGVTKDSNYDMLIEHNTGIPVVLKNTAKDRLLKVKGELWLVDTETLIKIDHIEKNGFIYERELTTIYVGKESVKAWVYMGVNSYWRGHRLVDSPKFTNTETGSTGKIYFHQYSEIIATRLTKKNEDAHVG